MINEAIYKDIVLILRDISDQASKKILEIYNSDFKINFKDDCSPLTKADIESNQIICSRLSREFPRIPIISEENKNKRLDVDTFFLIDPLDGTKEFIARNGEFTVNIALIIKNKPKLGVIQIPVKFTQYFSDGYFSFKYNGKLKKIHSESNCNNLRILSSRSHQDPITEKIVDKFKNVKIKKFGSSIKFCYLAEGKADIYLRNGKTMCWDLAAGIAILKTAGGQIKKLDLKKFELNKKSFLNESFISFRYKFPYKKLILISKHYVSNNN